MRKITGRILLVRTYSILLESGERRAFVPRGALELVSGELQRGAEVVIKLPPRLAEKKFGPVK